MIRTDPRLLEQMLRNLLSNAIKYTKTGRVLLGCRHRAGMLSIEVWDTGIGIAGTELASIFEEYRQLDNAARERSRGLGLGLAIVKRVGDLLGHSVRVRSRAGLGSVFAIEAAIVAAAAVDDGGTGLRLAGARDPEPPRQAAILLIEDDPDLRDLLQLVLAAEGHGTTVAADGEEALSIVARGKVRPDLILADYNLPLAMNGLQLAARLRERLHHQVPVIILTGDISTDTLRAIASQDCVQMIKPVKPDELNGLIRRLLPPPQAAHVTASESAGSDPVGPPLIYVVDDDTEVRGAISQVLRNAGHVVQDYASCEAFLRDFRPGREACLLIDAYLPGMHGIDLLKQLHDAEHNMPSIMITGDSDVAMALQAMKMGAMDLLEKPVAAAELLESVGHALELARNAGTLTARRVSAADHLTALTARQRQIMAMVLAGTASKNIAADLGISQRTVENHRASIMHKTGAKSLPALARLAVAAAWEPVV
jgi:two-component system CheB/CheR fusion protein